MIEAKHIDTVLRGTETIGGGLFPNQIAKRKKRAKQEKRVCKGVGCITKIVPYNRDKQGHLETLCYNCRSKTTESDPVHENYAYDPEDARLRYECPNGHDIAEVGRAANSQCRQCARDVARAQTKAKAEAEGRPYASLDSRVALTRLAEFMEKYEVSLNALERETGIPAGTLRGYAMVGEKDEDKKPKGYKCPPKRAKVIAEFFGVKVAVLAGEEE